MWLRNLSYFVQDPQKKRQIATQLMLALVGFAPWISSMYAILVKVFCVSNPRYRLAS